ncbi:trifunctional serine/threonine-protein kinase/ATP-binding protein/sensor histidine kinase [Calothrix sp. NIES-2098]|uniref:trifunctional serine/threonine-protein kinase/ATP-binding protein/sensor histidine kinase n=1 Tax=Calothrix sp. NIES-2098 TaxID=1954171 RepID=UPI000B6160CF|nr:multi-sensor signal transduction histidine kinase [Calothrix sp. NIES-2098]
MVSTLVSIPGYRIIEELYNGSRTLVYRAVRETDSLPVAIKLLKNPYPSFHELLSFRNQYTIAKNLNSPLIVQTYSLEPYQNGYALVMEDFGGTSLKNYFANVETLHITSLQEFLQIAVALCNTLDILYRDACGGQSLRIIHKDIKPSNILINPETKQVKLIDFSIASLLPRETQTLVNPNVLEGTLAYISPEQTGRMNRGIDYRTDFYSLGVTFYELLTGELPFASNDPMELVHCHLAQTSPLVHEINSKIPAVISRIISKLMAKNAEDRYQSALGLKYDLENCLAQLQKTGRVESFEIATRDVCDRFLIPDKIYGRETEVQTLLQAFDRVSLGATEMILVAGFSGIGKTAVVNEVHKPIVRQRGYFIKGKYDQFQRNIPLSAFVQAFRDLMGQLLTESDVQIQQWKTKILDAVGENGQVIIEVIPELSRIIGEQPPAIELSGTAAENRFNLSFHKFTQVFTSASHPLVIFLDDLQWADSASLKLMQLLMADTSNLFIIGAYRDNEVNTGHPLMLTLDEIAKSQANINTITLAPLSQVQVNKLIADTLKCSEDVAWDLSVLIYQKTKGNPFFATQFLKALHQDGLIQFDFELGCWQCNLSKVTAQAVTDDVVTFMSLQLQKLPRSTQDVLQLAACIGNSFDLVTLAIVSQQSEIETAAALWKALQEGLILPIGDIYKFYQQESLVISHWSLDNSEQMTLTGTLREPLRGTAVATLREAAQSASTSRGTRQQSLQVGKAAHSAVSPTHCLTNDQGKITVSYKFLHDRVQQAAYSLIPDDQKQATHYQIGKLLLQQISAQAREDRIFEIVNQLNHGTALITQLTEREELARLNLIACRKAKTSTAYQAAREYATAGLSLLGEQAWQQHYEMTIAFHEVAAEVAMLGGDFEAMEQFINIVIEQAHDLLEKVNVYRIRIQAKVSQMQFTEVLGIGINLLQQLGIKITESPTMADIQQSIQEISEFIDDQKVEDFADLPVMTDANKIAITQIASSIMATAYSCGSLLYPLLTTLVVKLSLRHGNISVSATNYACYSLVLCNIKKDIDSAAQFGQLALHLASKFDDKAPKPEVFLLLGGYILHRNYHIAETLPVLKEGYTLGLEIGNLEYAGYCVQTFCRNAFYCGQPLAELEQNTRNYYHALVQLKQLGSANACLIYWQAILNLLDFAEHPIIFSSSALQETEFLPLLRSANDWHGLYMFYSYKLTLGFLFGEVEAANNLALECRNYFMGGASTVGEPAFYFYDSLIALAQLTQRSGEVSTALERVAENQTLLQHWAHYAPMNYQHKVDLVAAEKCRVLGQKTEAIELYDQAISLAKANEYIQDEALGNELAAKFYLDWGKQRIAGEYMIEAYYGYARWGAKAKVADLEKRYPQLLAPVLQQTRSTLSTHETIFAVGTVTSTSANSSSSVSDTLDLKAILKASHTISSEIELEKLLASLLRIVIENAGADKCVLMLLRDDRLLIKGSISQGTQPVVLQNLRVEDSQDIPHKLIYKVKHSNQTVVLMDATADPLLANDPYIVRQQPKSILCSPILHQGKLMGILYLENNLTTEAFTSERVELLNLLCAQAAISLENARLYEQAQQMLGELSASKARFQKLADNLPGMIYQLCLAPDGSVSIPYISPGCAALYEVPPEDFLTGIAHFRMLEHPEDSPALTQAFIDSAETLTAFEQEWRIITTSGTVKWVQAASRPERQADGSIVWDGVMMDISDRKQAELALQQAQLQIIQSEKMSALGNLVAGVAHEMNNPLGFIAASIKQAKPTIADIVEHLKLYQETCSEQNEEITEHAQEIDLEYSLEDLPKMLDSMTMACDRLKNISTSLRTFSRADKDYKVPFNIHEGIDSTILILKHRLKANEQRPAIEVLTNYGNLPQIECFPGQLNQVFMNIMANAIDALEEANIGRDFAQIKAHTNQIIVTTSIENHLAKITITDNGKGMSESVKSKIFDHLFTTKAVGKGTGLGLAIARQIVEEAHGGKLSCKSVLGEGTEFSIKIPV